MSLLNIDYEYDDIINNKHNKQNLIFKKNHYLRLQRPMTQDEKNDFEKISLYLQLQYEIDKHRKKRNYLMKEGILII